MTLTADEKRELVTKFGKDESDTGATEVQIAMLTRRINDLTQLAGAISAARRHERPLTIAIVDIDHFKAVNDEHGHAAGDRVLAAVAS